MVNNIIQGKTFLDYIESKDPYAALNDSNFLVRREGYRLLGYRPKAFLDESASIRLEAFRALGYRKFALDDECPTIRNEASIYYQLQVVLNEIDEGMNDEMISTWQMDQMECPRSDYSVPNQTTLDAFAELDNKAPTLARFITIDDLFEDLENEWTKLELEEWYIRGDDDDDDDDNDG